VYIMEVLSQLANCKHGAVGDEFALGENEVP
jgi:hypothetical protein